MQTIEERQLNLNVLSNEIAMLYARYHGGVITVLEYLGSMAELYRKHKALDLSGLTDTTTWLKYPTEEEMAEGRKNDLEEAEASMGER